MVKKIEHYPDLVDLQAKFVNDYRLFAMRACRQGVVAEAEERPWPTPRSFSSSRPRGCRGGICEIAVNARSGSELNHARSAPTPGIAWTSTTSARCRDRNAFSGAWLRMVWPVERVSVS
jgi:hypothetical protein